MTSLPDGFILRHTTPADTAAAQQLLDDVESEEADERRRSPLELAAHCADPKMDLERNTWVVEARGGRLAAFGFLFWGDEAQGEAEPFVHPRYRSLGLGDALLQEIERHASELAVHGAPVTRPRLHVSCGKGKEHRRRWLLDRDFRAVRETYLMVVDLDAEAPATAPLPPGVELRPFVPELHDAALHAATGEAFADHFLYSPSTLEEWRAHSRQRAGFDPSLWLVAWEGAEIAGESLSFLDENESCVDSLSVRRPWRGRGLGLALLTRAFLLAHERGRRTVRLGVDAQNATGALALYLKAGMRVERCEEIYAKDLR